MVGVAALKIVESPTQSFSPLLEKWHMLTAKEICSPGLSNPRGFRWLPAFHSTLSLVQAGNAFVGVNPRLLLDFAEMAD